jgi:hypothetical protein
VHLPAGVTTEIRDARQLPLPDGSIGLSPLFNAGVDDGLDERSAAD